MDPEGTSHAFLLKLLVVNFLFAGSIWAGKSIFYLFADFAMFAFISTLIYVNVVSFIEKKRLSQSDELVIYVYRKYVTEGVERLMRLLNSFIATVLKYHHKAKHNRKKSLMNLIVTLLLAAGMFHFLFTIHVVWVAILCYFLNE